MRAFDFAPLYRSTVGFDRVTNLLDSLTREDSGQAYPPYNIEKVGDDSYRIVMAVAGFAEGEIEITQHDESLIVTGKQAEKNDQVQYLHRGIAGRAFERRFELADYIKVKGAALANGLLSIDLVREVPEEKKPRTIQVQAQSQNQAQQPKLAA